MRDAAIQHAIVSLLARRAQDASICPSEVARSFDSDDAGWRALMPRVRDVARTMAREGCIVISCGEVVLDPGDPLRGAIRLRRGPRFGA